MPGVGWCRLRRQLIEKRSIRTGAAGGPEIWGQKYVGAKLVRCSIVVVVVEGCLSVYVSSTTELLLSGTRVGIWSGNLQAG